MTQGEESAATLGTFRDAALVGVDVDREGGGLVLRFAMAGGGRQALSFAGVQSFKVNDLVAQSIVSRLMLSGVHEFTEAEMARRIRWSASHAGACFIGEDAVRMRIGDIREGRMRMLVLDQSFGAEAVVVFRDLVIEDC